METDHGLPKKLLYGLPCARWCHLLAHYAVAIIFVFGCSRYIPGYESGEVANSVIETTFSR